MSHTSESPRRVANAAPDPGPTTQRVLAPDLARGVMLLVIALAHVHLFTVLIGGPDVAPTSGDQAVTVGTAVFIDLRGYPMFAALFGYGLAQIYRRRVAQGYEWHSVRTLLRRRARWLLVFGLAHVALLFFGDILAVYGLVALVLVGALRFRDQTLVVLVVAWLPIGALLHALNAANEATSGAAGVPPAPDGVLNELIFRLTMFSAVGVMMFISTIVPFLIGILAGRHRVLEEPERHLRILRVTAFIGIPLGVLGGLPLGLAKAGLLDSYTPVDALLAGGLHQVSGYACGLGYAALIALITVRITDQRGAVITALAALGQRSMTFYLAQSLVWAALFASYTLNLQLTSPVIATGVAVAVWLTTVGLADLMRRRGMRGPAEVALRRLTYGPSREVRLGGTSESNRVRSRE